MMSDPIAIVGRGCVLPGCHTPDALWQAVRERRSLLTSPPPGIWGLPAADEARAGYIGGYVTGFENIFDPDRFDLGDIDARDLDPVFRWALSAALDAWEEAGQPQASSKRIGIILANLSYPSRAKADHAGDIWQFGRSDIHALNAFNAGIPARMIARALGSTGPAFSLDAACASSLYALHIACRKLHARSIDIALVGAVNAADNLMLHKGFEALQALSPTGQSRPFSSGADGLIPAEGAAAVVLKRLADVGQNEHVFALIRGTGLSNDGRRRGLLAPDATGQLEAMRRAYAASELSPNDIQYLECHATGTPVGDGVEISSAAALFGERDMLPIGSLKSNTGHLITAAGLASLLKMLSAFEHETLPPTRLDGQHNSALAGTNLVPQQDAAPWTGEGLRRAAISNFGFGGNNAHLILEEAPEKIRSQIAVPYDPPKSQALTICGIGVMAGPDRGQSKITRRLMSPPQHPVPRSKSLPLNPAFARVPPTDLAHSEAQQLAILDVCEEALEGVSDIAPDRVGVFAGTGCASDAARWLLRERLATRLGAATDDRELAVLKDQIIPPISSAGVLGAMPNMPANRLNAACDFRGQGFTVAAEDLTGKIALELASEALQSGEIDMAIVTAADFATETVRASALRELGLTSAPADIACAIVLKRKTDTDPATDENYGTINTIPDQLAGDATVELARTIYGSAPIADDLFHLAIAGLLARRGQCADNGVARPAIGVDADAGADIALPAAVPTPDPLRAPPALFWAAARSRKTLVKRIEGGKPGGKGRFRIAMLATSPGELEPLMQTAARALASGASPSGEGVYYGERPADGELAFVFTGSAAAYPRMGRGLLMAFPELVQRTGKAFPEAAQIAHLLAKSSLTAYEQLCAVTLVSQAQTLLLRDMLGLKADALLGLSLGETNALIAFGFWKDAGYLLNDIAAGDMYERHLGGAFETARTAWKSDAPVEWVNWRIYAPMARVQEAIAEFPHIEITIIYSHEDCVIGGPPEACRSVVDALGKGAGAMMNQHLIVHAKAMIPYGDTWRALHTRPTSAKPTVRIYGNAGNAAYKPSKAKVADMLTKQAISTVDFPKTVEQAYADGVRTFVEIGPRNTLATSIGKILHDRPHLSVAADQIETSDLGQIAVLAATLFADGRDLNIEIISRALTAAAHAQWPVRPVPPAGLQTPAHFPAPVVPTARRIEPAAPPDMPPAPHLAAPNYAGAAKTSPSHTDTPSSIPSGRVALPCLPATGPSFSRTQLEASSTGQISDLFGDRFAQQDNFSRQVRLPAPPMLLVDRITGLDAEPGVEGKGRIWTETDVAPDAWYMHNGFMRPGPLIEAGQADLSLISWMGVDFRNQNERVYRLLGCELTLHEGGLPRAGETLQYQIEITGHAALSGVRMFFFQYDCYASGRRLFSVRNGQAGFFTDEELAAGKGVLWDPTVDPAPTENPAKFKPAQPSTKRSFPASDLALLRAGDAYACFGDGFEACAAQTNPPHLPDGKLALFDAVPVFDPVGGPWGRGYLKAAVHVPVDAWFYDGHFHNDPCMPGTLMAEAAVQALEFYAAAIGMTTTRDGFVFEPITDEMFKFICRGQVVPDAPHDLTYEIFINEIIDGDTPELYAAMLATSDGKKVFYCPRFGLRLRRNWPLVPADTEKVHIGPSGESRGDWAALKACGDGAPSDAFGKMYEAFDAEGRVPRLPQPPYHFISRVLSISTRPNQPEIGATVVTEYDVPPDAWYFSANSNGAMPFAVLLEIVLQPCGWLASHGGFALSGGECFRNLDGDGRVLREIRPGDGPVRVEAVMTRFSRVGSTTIVFFELTATSLDGETIMTLETSFGFFPMQSLVKQAGLKITDEQRAQLALPSTPHPVPDPSDLLPAGQMEMLDGVDFFDADGGASGLGLIRGRQQVDPYAWYFKAHFYQDPVQPGSLGLDALVQLLERAVILKGLADATSEHRFESTAIGEPVAWSYRGQVTPRKQEVTTIIELTDITDEDGAVRVSASGSLWCDGLRIYEASNLSVRLVKPHAQ